MQMHVLAAQLMGQRRIAAHPPLLLIAQLSRSYGDDAELGVLSGRICVSPLDASLEPALGRDAKDDPAPDLPRRLDAVLSHESDELAIGVLGNDTKGGFAKGFQR